jgi:hypothetical protein
MSGFQKILKKFDKVTGKSCKRAWIADHADTAVIFLPRSRDTLDKRISDIRTAYAELTNSSLDIA